MNAAMNQPSILTLRLGQSDQAGHDHLERNELFGSGDPIFPATRLGQDEFFRFKPIGLARKHWSGAASARSIIKSAFEAAGLPKFTPHSFRNMLVAEMYRRRFSIAAFKAGSQNLGHEYVMTTLTSYGKIGLERQGELIREAFSSPVASSPDSSRLVTREDVEALLREKGIR